MSENMELIQQLSTFGLTQLQARIYVELLRLGSAKALDIYRGLGVDRAEVYRALKELKKIGLLETELAYPSLYIPIRAESALNVLISERQEEVELLRRKETDLLRELNDLSKSHLTEVERKGFFFRVLTGPQIYERPREVISRASDEVLKVVSGQSLQWDVTELSEVDKLCSKKGVRIRTITEIDANNVKVAEKYARLVELKHSIDAGQGLRYIIVDASQVFVRATVSQTRERLLLWTNNSTLVQGFLHDFDKLWTRSSSAESRIQTLTH